MTTGKKGTFGSEGALTAAEASRRGVEARQRKRQAQAEGPTVSMADTEEIIRALRDRAKSGDHLAARELREWISHKKITEGAEQDKRLFEMLSPELRDAVAIELNGGSPPDWMTEMTRSQLAVVESNAEIREAWQDVMRSHEPY